MKYQLILSDVDSTLITQEVIDLLASKCGRGEEVAEVTRAAMSGELEFKEALFRRVSCLAGLSISVLDEVASEITLSPGAQELREFCSKKGIKFGAVTGGFYQVLERHPFFNSLDFLRANTLEIKKGELTGKVEGEVIDRNAKATYLLEFARNSGVEINTCIAIGDGANDLEMIKSAGLGIAFKGKEILKAKADLCIEKSLAEVIAFLE